jgi:hypothetical protein
LNRLIIRPAGSLDGTQIARAAEIYRDCFPDHLRVPFDELAGTGPCDQLHIAFDRDQPVGLAAVKRLEAVRWTFLRYFAIDPRRRREHLGLDLWRLLGKAITADGWPDLVCFEVEDPAEAGDDADRQVREDRVRFWTSCGTVPLPVPGYVMPDFTGLAAAEPMLLMAPDSAAAHAKGDRLAGLVLALYAERYGLPLENSLVTVALNSIPDRS